MSDQVFGGWGAYFSASFDSIPLTQLNLEMSPIAGTMSDKKSTKQAIEAYCVSARLVCHDVRDYFVGSL